MLASSFLAACSSSSKQAESSEQSTTVAESKEESKEASGDSTVLRMLVPGYDSGYLKKELDNGIAGFEKANEGVKVEIVSVGWMSLIQK